MPQKPAGYAGKMLRVDLSQKKTSEEMPEEATLRQYLGGTGLGIDYLYKEVSPATRWDDPANRVILASGPLGGTRVGGSSSFSVVTKGCLTNGATSSQANGFFGAFLRFCGYDGIIFQGAADRLTYLHIDDDKVELRDATHIAGKDTWETEELIKKELGKSERECSVFSIGPAGENLVKFACLAGDRGHVASHNGLGAVLGSKRLKAIAVSRGKKSVALADKENLSHLAEELFQKIAGTAQGAGYRTAQFGTAGDVVQCKGRIAIGSLPVKNYTANLFPGYEAFAWENFGPLFEVKPRPCWACRFKHCHIMTVKAGRHAGYVGEEPEYEQFASWGPVIGQHDVVEAFVLSNYVDRLGLDTNEAAWLIAWLMECQEKGLLNKNDTDGIEMRWGDAEAVKAMLSKIARREDTGNVLAEGIKRAAEHFGAKAGSLAIYTQKGNTPRTHDHRNLWQTLLDTCVSDTSTDAASAVVTRPEHVGYPAGTDPFSPPVVAKVVAGTMYRMPLDDCLGMCRMNNRGVGVDYVAQLLKAATGWDITADEATAIGYRVANLLRVFNLRHGLTSDLDAPSARYGSTPVDGPHQGKSIMPVWREMVQEYYRLMGWDMATGRPLPKTLEDLGLGHTVKDIWQ